MQGTQNEFELLTLTELFDAFEKVDDIAYPKRATSLYCQLLKKSGKSPQELCQHYKYHALIELVGNASLLSEKSSDTLFTNKDVIAKITRMQMMI